MVTRTVLVCDVCDAVPAERYSITAPASPAQDVDLCETCAKPIEQALARAVAAGGPRVQPRRTSGFVGRILSEAELEALETQKGAPDSP